ncbi:uncharacterized protein LOC8286244 [Ricinus communis]|uniref:Electron transporter, putative n=1 Tax=Ricinus communis TaxID=3988 RepID=B9RYM7_RICCO|nr:uncharacterized protein LOC8286244 [Ricinus communis]EEF43379.1 electron transporter, putative [Ricinus communis]|eukprot:XP_002518846.1 uncharacterized protein LOC8286244 [Ricinus communis]
MGCNSSKAIEATTVAIYRPPPSSFAVFDINSIQEPWLSMDNTTQENQEKPTHLPAPILEKLNKLEADTPHTWDEVSKALEDLKPALDNKSLIVLPPPPKPDTIKQPTKDSTQEKKQAPKKSSSFHTVEELDAKLSSKESRPKNELRKSESMGTGFKKTEVMNKTTDQLSRVAVEPETGSGKVIKPVKENIFILRDRQEREKEGKMANYDKMKRLDPLSEYPEKIPPNGGAESVVIYTTSLRGVRKTFEDCNRVRSLLEGHRVVFDERDVSLHGDFLNELRELLGEEASVPRVFVKGRYFGGVDNVIELNETGRLGRIMSWARVERGVGRQACEGCGGARFVPCVDCGGSCKVLVDGVKERCGECNENGLMLCPACL